jgi:hypothetical protein
LRFGRGFQQGSQKGATDFIVPAFIAWGDPTGARAGRA